MNPPESIQSLGYKVIEYLGNGARSTIWHVQDRRTGEAFALKRVIKQVASDARFLEQAENEGRIGSLFTHPVIRHVHEVRRLRRWFSVREVHLVMELCRGVSLQEECPTSVREIVRIFTHVAEALAYMNARGYVHADMKPNNIIVAPDGGVKIIDFGQSCAVGTVKRRIQGTPDFIAPEQVHRRPLDGRTDVFNFGASLYWALSGKPIPTVLPRSGSITIPVNLAAEPLDRLNPAVPGPLNKLVADAIELQPSRRPASMNEVVSRLGLIAYKLDGGAAGPARAEG